MLGYLPRMFYKDNSDPQFKSWTVDKNTAILRNMIKELKVNLTESQELQIFYQNKHIKKHIYWPWKFVWLSSKYMKIK